MIPRGGATSILFVSFVESYHSFDSVWNLIHLASTIDLIKMSFAGVLNRKIFFCEFFIDGARIKIVK